MDKRIKKYTAFYRSALAKEQFPDLDQKTDSYRRRLSGMYASDAYKQHNIYPTMNVEMIYAVIAMCLELREYGLSDPEIIDFVNVVFKKRKKFFKVLLSGINLLPNSYEIAEKWNISDHDKRVKDGSITYDFFEVSDRKVEYSISGCKYVEIFEYYGIRPLCKIFCMTDVTSYASLPAHVKFIRHSDLSDGDCCHDEVIRREKKTEKTGEKEQTGKTKVSEETEVFRGKNWDGILYPAEDRKDRIMIVFTGSEGGLDHAKKTAKYLQDNGIPAFALGYFKTKHSAGALDLIPVEIIGSVMKRLRSLGYKKIGVEGVSKGAELALAAAIRYPQLSCVILKTPSWFYSEGLKGGRPSGNCCWSLKGEGLPYTPYKERKINMPGLILKNREYNILEVNTDKKVVPESVIEIERIKAPILMFSTRADTIWPSTESCEKMCARLQEKGFAYPYKHIAFDHMSHMMLEYCGKEIKYFIKSEKEDPAACYAEREIMGNECVKWIEEVWQEKQGEIDLSR